MKETYPSRINWPEQRFGKVPDIEVATSLAAEANVPLPVRPYLSTLGIEIKDTNLKSSCGAIMIPSPDRRSHFRILYDPDKPLSPDLAELGITEDSKEDFILGHELGHTFFFRWQPGSVSTEVEPTLLSSTPFFMGKPLEEFCDAFGLAILQK